MEMPQPRTRFEWPVYADATFAGLSILLPIPLVDWVFEQIFRRRMPGAIAAYRHNALPRPVVDALNRGQEGCVETCLLLPFQLTLIFIKRLSRKLLYFLTIKEASDALSYYWHRAFLIDYMLLAGHLDNEGVARIARMAMDRVLDNASTSPLRQLASQVLSGTHHVWRTLRRARKGQEDEGVKEQKTLLARRWSDFEDYWKNLAARYEQTYHQIESEPVINSGQSG